MKKLLLFFSLLLVFFLSACGDEDEITITFVGFDGEVLETISFNRTDQPELNYPEAPEVPGYMFDGWSKSLDNIEEDVTITAIYLVLETGEALASLLQRVLESENYAELVNVYVDNVYERTITYQRDFDRIFMSLQRVDFAEVRLMVDIIDGEHIGYEYLNDEWITAPLTEAQYRHIRFTHSQRRMLPIEFNMDWFNVNENVYTVKVTEFNNMLEYIPMAGHFDSYRLTVEEDALILNVEIYDHTLSLVRYEIKFYDFDETIVEALDLD